MNRLRLYSIASTLLASLYWTGAAEPRDASPKADSPKAGGDVYDAVVSHDVSANYKDWAARLDFLDEQVGNPQRRCHNLPGFDLDAQPG